MYNEQLQNDLMPKGKIWDKMRADTAKIARIEQIVYDNEQGQDISWGDLIFLQENQDFIMQVFCDDVRLWELAGIDEQIWNDKHQGGKND